MWDNPRLLNLAALGFAWVALALFGWSGLQLLQQSSLFPIREADITAGLKNASRDEIAAAIQANVRGNFFAVDLGALRSGLERLPWVRRAEVRRVWPDRLEVTLEEHVALARWGADGETGALVNTFGERFAGKTNQTVPLFVGPAGSEGEVARRYARFGEAVAPLGARVERVVLSARHAWQLRLDSGLTVMLGRDADRAEERLRRFVSVYGQIAKGQKHEYVDLRYPNGFAVRVGARS